MFKHPRSWFVFRFDKTGNGVILNIYKSLIHNATFWLPCFYLNYMVAEDSGGFLINKINNNNDNNTRIK